VGVVCGIVGYVGGRRALPVLLDGLRRLEYRGYDSAGVALQGDDAVVVCKRAGRVEALAAMLADGAGGGACGARAGIGHTRWATHGGPSDENAHPHADEGLRVAVVHNGIIENHAALRAALQARGHAFRSDTDSEVVAHLIDEALGAAADRSPAAPRTALREAVAAAVRQLQGSFALVALARDDPEALVGVRQATPLVIGLGDGEHYLASDVTALLPYTRRMLVLQDGEIAEVRPQGVSLFDFAGRPLPPRVPERIAWDVAQAERGGYAHFMRKEIDEQPEALAAALRGRLTPEGPALEELEAVAAGQALASAERVVLLGCGTAFHAGLVGRSLLERWALLPAEVEVASEFRDRPPLLGPGTVAVAVSQSGETADTLAALREARARGAATLAVVNVVGSSIARAADAVLYTRAGPEIAVASTKAYTTQIALLSLLAQWTALRRRAAGQDAAPPPALALESLPQLVRQALGLEARVQALAVRLAAHSHCFFIGRGLDWAAAVEGQLKLKEVSYLHAEAYPAGELKHGALALVEAGTPVVALLTQPRLAQKTASNVAEVRARGGWVLAVTTPSLSSAVEDLAAEVLQLPETPPELAPAVAAIPLQLLAYHAAVARGCDVDRPRNLAKSVTVE
jgi:glucosamine--fructose-6-phosphate aminotransferase (isomerizing)